MTSRWSSSRSRIARPRASETRICGRPTTRRCTACTPTLTTTRTTRSEMEYDRTKLNFHESQEEVWIVQQGSAFVGVAVTEEGARQLPGIDPHRASTSTKAILFRPSLKPVYGGPTLTEALWAEMDSIMDRLMGG